MYRELSCTYGYEDRPLIVRVPTSCRCGGDEAFVIRVYGTDEMIGCTCHHDLIDYKEDGYWRVALFELVGEVG